MTILLARTAHRLYWGARYVERAEDTARIVRAYNDLAADYPSREPLRWEPLAAVTGSQPSVQIPLDDATAERSVLHYLMGDRTSPSSIATSVSLARENLRTAREVMPREAWQAVNELSQYVASTARRAVERRLRDRFLLRVVEVCRRLDGILESTMTRSHAYDMLRLGRLVERADMTTRVLGVAAAAILHLEAIGSDELIHDEVRWMSVLRSVSALQMYQRAVRGPIDGASVVEFLLSYSAFPRSVQGCFDEIRAELLRLPSPGRVLGVLGDAEATLAGSDPTKVAGLDLDQAMDRVQIAIAGLDAAIFERYVGSAL
jgi:uncharacterized alpha-E superfamily protein